VKKPSYSQFHYGLRPAKHVERKMMAEAFLRLAAFEALSEYRYVGLGSVYFVDIALIHRLLRTHHIVSIEKRDDAATQRRFMFNRPFACVDVRFGPSEKILPSLPWDRRSIVWLDYDGGFAPSVLTDLSTVAASVRSGSLVCFTVNGTAPKDDVVSDTGEVRRTAAEKFSATFKGRPLPHGFSGSNLTVPEYPKIVRQMGLDQIERALADRNKVLPPPKRLSARQIFFFRYADNAPMITVGWVIVSESELSLFASARIGDLDFIRTGDDFLAIDVPILTQKELKYLEHQLPVPLGRRLKGRGLTDEELRAFEALYRYYPSYAEVVG
jgi:hypothetical protein